MVNNLLTFLDMMAGLKDLFERRAKGIVADMAGINKKLVRLSLAFVLFLSSFHLNGLWLPGKGETENGQV